MATDDYSPISTGDTGAVLNAAFVKGDGHTI